MYEPTIWKTGDTITAERLNKLEKGVRDNQGADATINGQNVIEIVQGDNIIIDQETPGRLKISAVGGGSGIPLESIEITTPPDKTEYNAGESFESSGMVVTARYAFGLSQVVTGYTVTPSGALTGDVTEITITYSEGGTVKTAKQPVTVTRLTAALSVKPSEIALDADTQTATAQVTYNGDGEITVESSAPDVVSAEISGTTVTVKSLSDASQTVTVTVTAPETGIYTSATAELTVENYVTAHVYGAEWDGSATTKWSRTDDAELFADPEPAVNNGTGSSPFDDLMPWAGVEIAEDGTSGTLVKIPKYWYKWARSGAAIKLQISDAPQEGFCVSPAHMDRGDGQGERDVIYVGRYSCSDNFTSESGVQAKVNSNLNLARESIHNLAPDIWQFDITVYWTIWMLYLVEFADWDMQRRIGYGCGKNTQTGLTDTMTYHTGTPESSREEYGAVQYRNIENLWSGNHYTVDGILLDSGKVYFNKNPATFGDISSGIVAFESYNSFNGVITDYDISKNPESCFMLYPSQGGGTTDTCITDGEFPSSGRAIYTGGAYNVQGLDRGGFLWGIFGETEGGFVSGCRLMKLPNSEVS